MNQRQLDLVTVLLAEYARLAINNICEHSTTISRDVSDLRDHVAHQATVLGVAVPAIDYSIYIFDAPVTPVSRVPHGPPLYLVCSDCNYNRHVCAACGDELTHNEAKGINGSSHPCYHDHQFRLDEYNIPLP